MTDESKLLVALLGRVDAVFEPVGIGSRTFLQSRYEAQQAYRAGGLPWRSDATSEAQRKVAERSLAKLFEAGLVVVTHAGGRSSRWRLTQRGDDHARQLCGLPPLADTRGTLFEVLRCTLDGRAFAGGLVELHTLTGLAANAPDADYRAAVSAVTDIVLPLLVWGLVEETRDGRGVVFFRVTAAGLDLLTCGKLLAVERQRRDPGAWERYLAALRAERGRLESSPPSHPSELGGLARVSSSLPKLPPLIPAAA